MADSADCRLKRPRREGTAWIRRRGRVLYPVNEQSKAPAADTRTPQPNAIALRVKELLDVRAETLAAFNVRPRI